MRLKSFMKNSDVIAFGDLYDRSVANEKNQLLDRIAVRDYVIEAEIGAFQSERGKKQRLRVSVVLEVDLVKSNKHDDVDNIISYDTIIDAINKQLSIERINLLETFADQVATDVLSDFRVKRAFVRVEKLDRIPGALGVEIVRSPQSSVRKGNDSPFTLSSIIPDEPLFVFITNEILGGNMVSEWLDRLDKHHRPVVICVDSVMELKKLSENKLTQRRIDLLAIEQNAWVLAGKDERCVVVNSRTEIEWAIKNNQLSIWAPSKIVLDAVHKPMNTNAIELANWFSKSFSNEKVVVLGEKPFPGFRNIINVSDI